MYKENYIESLRRELVEVVQETLTPVALKYGYSEVALESTIKWRPFVLIIGNYSSGKSTLINEIIGQDVQKTGQAPTDDSFTVITHTSSENSMASAGGPAQAEGAEASQMGGASEQRSGHSILSDPSFPFEGLKRFGQRFASHFQLKTVDADILQSLALIDTPGMLDSVSERDRGYDYQQVIGELAQMADLVLVLFDPHKAGTIKETYTSLRETLPAKTFEDRVVFVLNRMDECSNLNDLLRVYGTLCWNLSQMTGRKDIPHIHLTFSPKAQLGEGNRFLEAINDQRVQLKNEILRAPQRRLDHLTSFAEMHAERMACLLSALKAYRLRRSRLRSKWMSLGVTLSIVAAAASAVSMQLAGYQDSWLDPLALGLGALSALAVLTLWWGGVLRRVEQSFQRSTLTDPNGLVPLKNQMQIDTWEAVKEQTIKLIATDSMPKAGQMKKDYDRTQRALKKITGELRTAINDLNSMPVDSR